MNIAKSVALVTGVLVGTFHLILAFGTIFVFRNDEPMTSWIYVFIGPLSTLPASIVAFFFPKAGGTWLLVGGLVSFLVLVWAESTVVPFHFLGLGHAFVRVPLPMMILGIAAIVIGWKIRRRD